MAALKEKNFKNQMNIQPKCNFQFNGGKLGADNFKIVVNFIVEDNI